MLAIIDHQHVDTCSLTRIFTYILYTIVSSKAPVSESITLDDNRKGIK